MKSKAYITRIAIALVTLLILPAPAFPLGLEKRETILPSGTESGLQNPAAIWFDRIRGYLVVANTHARQVLVLNRQGQVLKVIGKEGEVTFPIAVGGKGDGTLFVAEKGSEGLKIFPRYDSLTEKESGLLDLAPFRRSTLVQPVALHLDEEGKLYVLDRGNRQVLVFGSDGKFRFAILDVGDPADLAVDASGNIFLADPGFGGIRVFAPTGKWLRTIGGYTSQFREPLRARGVTVDRRGRVWLVEEASQRIRALDSFGNLLFTMEAGLVIPADIVTDGNDNLFVLEQGGNRITSFHIREF